MGFGDVSFGLSSLFKPKPPPQTDPLAFLNSVSMPSSQDLYSDAMSQVGNAYQAQLGNLNAQERDTRSRANTGDAQLDAMYKALQRDIGANAKNLSGIYDSASANSARNTASTKNAINAQYTQTNNELA